VTYLSVCSGIEAATCAWHDLGMEPAGFSEIEQFPNAVLAHHYPEVTNYGDMTTYKEWNIGRTIDLLVGGTPCQSFSVAGLRKGLSDPRGNLMLTYGAIAGSLRPTWLVWENVPGVLSSNKGRDFGTFLGMLAELGYGFAYRVLDAQYFGVPQRRRRVFVVGYLGDWRRAAAVLFESESLRGYSPPSREAGQGAAAPITSSFEKHGGRTAGNNGKPDNMIMEGVEIGPAGGKMTTVNPTLDARAKDGPVRNQLAGAVLEWPAQVTPALDASFARLQGQDDQHAHHGAGLFVPDVCHTVTAKWSKGTAGPAGDEHHNLVAFSCKDHGADAGDIAPTLRGMGYDSSHANGGGQIAVAHTLRAEHDASEDGTGRGVPLVVPTQAVRRLTPRECERLQGFPDDYTNVTYRNKPAADGPRYKALGNSMAVPVMRWIGQRIQEVNGD